VILLPTRIRQTLVQTDFQLFSPTHLAILASMPLLAAALAGAARNSPNSDRVIRYALAVFLAADGLIWYGYRYFVLNVPLRHVLPFELCDISFWIIVWILLRFRQRGFDLAYYLGAGGAAMAMITPSLTQPLLTYPSIEFLAGHGMMVVAVLYLLWTKQARPRPGSWKYALVMLNIFAALVGLIDLLLGSNYMYLRHKPPTQSLFDLLGGWPWYIFFTEFVSLAIFFVMSLPYRRSADAIPAAVLSLPEEAPDEVAG